MKIDFQKVIPSVWELPEELFFNKIYIPTSNNPTINFCDSLTRKAATFYDNFMGDRKPIFAKRSASVDTIR